MLNSVSTVTLLGVLVQGAAFVRMSLIAASLGVSAQVDAYNLGLIAPSLVVVVVGGWLQVGYLGRYTVLLTEQHLDKAAAYRWAMLATLLSIVVPCAIVCVAFPGPLMALFLPGEQLLQATIALQALAWYMIPTAAADFMGLTLNGHKRFGLAAGAPLISALVSIVALGLWPEPGLGALVWSLVIGSAAQLLLVGPAFVRLGLQRDLTLRGAHREVKDTLKLGAPILPAVLFSNATLALVQFHTAQLGEGAVSIMGYAVRLHSALSQVLVIGLSTVLLPHFAELWSRGRKKDIQVLFRRLTRGGILIATLLVAGIYLFGASAVAIMFVRGAFDEAAANQVAQIWLLYSLALFPLAFGTFVAKLVSAMRQPVVLLASGFILFAVTWMVASAGADTGDIANVAIAGVASFSATAVFWLAWLSRHLEVKPLLWDILNGVLRVAVVVGPVVLTDHYLAPLLESWSAWSQLLIRIGIFSAIAVSLLWVSGLHRWFFASAYDGVTKHEPSS